MSSKYASDIFRLNTEKKYSFMILENSESFIVIDKGTTAFGKDTE